MDYKKANRAFLYMILATICFTLLYTVWMIGTMTAMPVMLNNFLSEMMIFIPALAMIFFHGDKVSVLVPFKKIRIPSALLIPLYVLLLFPLVVFINSLSMLFVDNTVVEMADQILELPLWQMILSIGIFGPFIEEFVFRGMILQSYQRTGRIVGSIVLSSILFGMMHLNINQFLYGAAMGVMFALLVEATGSVLSSFLAHALFNSAEVVLMYIEKDVLRQAQEYMDGMELKNTILISVGVYFVLAVIGTALAMCVLVKISNLEKRQEFFASIPKCKKQGYKLLSVPLIVAIVISLTYMIGIEVIFKITGV